MFNPQPHQGHPHPQPRPGQPGQAPQAGQPHQREERWRPNLIAEKDLELLKQIVDSDEEAQSLFNMLQNSPPEIGALGYLVLRAFERSQS